MFDKLFVKKADHTGIQFTRYILMSVIAFGSDFSLLYGLNKVLLWNYLIASAISYTVGMVVKYVLSSKWVFSSRVIESRWIEFWTFSAFGFVGGALTMLIIWLLKGVFGLDVMYSKLFAASFVFIVVFLGRKYTLYR